MASPGKYVVYIDEKPLVLYDNERQGYTLAGATSFARIGSQTGKPRMVTRGVKGPCVRVYEKGQRVWPVYAEQVNSLSGKQALQKNEFPNRLVFKIGGVDQNLSIKLKKVGHHYKAIPNKKSKRDEFLKKHPSWK